MHRLLVLALPLLLLTACAQQPSGGGGTNGATEPPAPSGPNATVEALLTPNEDGLTYPVYETYDEIDALLRQEDGRTYVINFWATWCAPCVAEMPYFEQLADETDTEVIMVSLDFRRDIRTKLKTFVEKRELDLPVVALADSDYNSFIDRVSPEWSGAIPATVIYRNADRKFHGEKFASYEELRDAVAELR
ncbi:TlpA disulfide reductase family protein [Lewinella sp. W8]|uniref:TlpA family protein disulfide reductase n=1 Tax=Lewinella sp. W8 TaxID=2528208 RepID=UPI0010680E52|nr:TlpA disulfide reductase family protein [Lewinella sp. W8]MTB52819.1 redoxin domain-containing protein [Lewinella sp. W8]